MYLRTRHTGFHVPWWLLPFVGTVWLSIMIMYFAFWLVFWTGRALFELVSAAVVAYRTP